MNAESASAASDPASNPLLAPGSPPAFDRIRPEHVVPAVRALLAELAAELERVEAAAAPDWPRSVDPIERIGDRLSRVWGTVGHLMGVRNSDDLRRAHDEVQGEVVAFSMRMGQSRPLYLAFKALRDGPGFASLDAAQQRIVQALVRDAELSGVGLEGERQERFNRIQAELAEGMEPPPALARGSRRPAGELARTRRTVRARGRGERRNRRSRPLANHA